MGRFEDDAGLEYFLVLGDFTGGFSVLKMGFGGGWGLRLAAGTADISLVGLELFCFGDATIDVLPMMIMAGQPTPM